VQVGDVLLCLTNTKPHPVTPTTSIHYIKQKIMGAPGTTCRLKLQRNDMTFDVDLKRSAFSQPVLPLSNDSGSGNRVKEEIASTKAETNVRGVVSSCAADLTAQRMSVRSSVSSRASGSGGDTCGVGLRLTKDANGNIVIAELAPGGPAHLSGNVMEGDVILCLQNKYPHEIKPSTSIEYVQRKMRGRPGKSEVYLLC
jgi:C-terminal processing protease CtpA/Prc